MQLTYSKGMLILGALLLLCAVAAAGKVHAQDFLYDVDVGGITGTITTTCDNCSLNETDIASWSFATPVGGLLDPPLSISSSVAGAQTAFNNGFNLFATRTDIVSNLGGSAIFSNATNRIYIGQSNIGATEMGFPMEIDACAEAGGCIGTVYAGTVSIARIAATAAPEIQTGWTSGALTLLMGIVATMTGASRNQCAVRRSRI